MHRFLGAFFQNLNNNKLACKLPNHVSLIISISQSTKTLKNSRIHHYSTISDHIRNHRLDEARRIFEKLPNPTVELYTKMVTGYAVNRRLDDALQLFVKMPVRDTVAWNAMLKGCLDCGEMRVARKLFDQMPCKNAASWTTMINGYMKFGDVRVAEGLFEEIPDRDRDVAAWNCMINGYCSNGRVDDGFRLFERMPSRNVISWTSMISGFDQRGRSDGALRLFQRMVDDGVEPTASTYCCVLTACIDARAQEVGIQIHARAVKLGCVVDEFVTSSLITFYANCKEVENCRKVFCEKVHDSVVVWTSLLTGYSLNSMHDDALEVFRDMTRIGIFPNESSFTSALKSCCAFTSVDKGMIIHAGATKLGFVAYPFVGNSLVTLYSKCGSVDDAIKAFDGIKEKNIVSWNSIIVGCAEHGYIMWVLVFFAHMLRAKEEPNEITLTGLLYAAIHSGQFMKGRRLFLYFGNYTTIKLSLEHYACMVDIICRSGNLEEAEEFIKNMPIKANSLVWLTLLSACRTHGNFEVAERASKCILNIDPLCSAAYTLLSNVYAAAGRWNDVSRIRRLMNESNVTKQEGCSWLNLISQRHEIS